MLNKLYKKIFASIIVSTMLFSMIPAGAIEAGINTKSQNNTVNNSSKSKNAIGQQKGMLTNDDYAILNGIVPRGELLSEAIKKQTQRNLELQNSSEYIKYQPTVKEVILNYKRILQTKYKKDKKTNQGNTFGKSVEKYQISQQELDILNNQKSKKMFNDKTKPSDTLDMLNYAAKAMDLSSIDKDKVKNILSKPDKLDLLIEHSLLSKALKVNYSSDEMFSDKEDYDDYDAKYYSERLDKLISNYLEKSKMSEQDAVIALKTEIANSSLMLSINTMSTDTTIDYTAGLNKYFANSIGEAFDPGERADVNPASGALQYKSTDVSLKGRNGLDLNISIMFDSNKALLYDKQLKHSSANFTTDENGITINYIFPVFQYNDYTEEEIRNELGTGWSFGFPFIEIAKDASYQHPRYLHMGDGMVYQLDGTQILNYTKGDMSLEYDDYSSSFILRYADGKTLTFDSMGKLLEIKDRYENNITFYYQNRGAVGANRTRSLLSKITDSMGRDVTFNYSGDFDDATRQVSIYYLGENNQQNTVTYDLQAIQNSDSYNNVIDAVGFNSFLSQMCSEDVENFTGYKHYKLVKKTDQEQRETKFNYDGGNSLEKVYTHNYSHYAYQYAMSNTYEGYNAPVNLDNVSTKSSTNLQLVMSEIEYPTGGRTEFEYGSLYKAISECGSEFSYKAQVLSTADYDENNVLSNEINYEYYCSEQFFIEDVVDYEIPLDFEEDPLTYYSGKVLADNNILITIILGKYLVVQGTIEGKIYEDNHSVSYSKVSNYGAYNGQGLPKLKINSQGTVRSYNIAGGNFDYIIYSRASLESFEYDTKGNITKFYSIEESNLGPDLGAVEFTEEDIPVLLVPSDPGDIITCTYHPLYNYLTEKTYKTNINTTIREEYVPTSDEKSVAFANIYENNVLKKKTGYIYDSYGNVIETRKYQDDFVNYIATQYEYSSNGGNLISIKTHGVHNADGGAVTTPNEIEGTVVKKFEYDQLGNLIKETDANDNVTQYEYDKLKRVTKLIFSDGKYITCSYDDTYNIATYTNENGTVLDYIYDSYGRLTNIKDAQSNQNLATYVYDTVGRLIQENNHNSSDNSFQTEYTYEFFDMVSSIKVKDKSNNLISHKKIIHDLWQSDLDGETYIATATITIGDSNSPGTTQVVLSTIEGDIREVRTGIITEAEYPYFIQSLETHTLTTYEYDYINRRVSEKSPRYNDEGGYPQSYSSKVEYDYAGNVTKQYNALGNYATATYNALGQKVSEADVNAVAASRPYSKAYTYDELGRVIKTETPMESNATSIAKVYYDPNGNVISNCVTNNQVGSAESFKRTDYQYNSRNMLKQVAMYNGSTVDNYTAYYYDGAGNILRMYTGLSQPITITGLDQYTPSSASCSVTKYAYDRFGNLTSLINPLNQTQTFEYDLNKNLVYSEDANNNETSYTYDGLSRMLSKNVTGTSGNLSQTQTYTKTGQIKTIANSNLSTTYIYDNLDRVVQAIQNNGVEKSYTYDANGNRKSFIATVGGAAKINTTYEYDKLDRLTTVKENGAVVATYSYDNNGNRTGLTYSNGNSATYTYNNANMLKTLTNKQGANAVSSYSYDYYLDGNQKSKTEGTGKVTNYAYDKLGRLSTESVTQSGTTDVFGYSYDVRGNRSTMTAGGSQSYSTAYVYDAANKLLNETKTVSGTDEVTDYFYDNNGNQISKRKSTIAESQDSQSNSIQDAASQNSLIEQYEYNALNQLAKSTVNGVTAQYTYQPDGLRYSKAVGTNTTHFTWDGDQLSLETDGSNELQAKYVRGINGLYREDGSSNKHYYLYNGHGDVVQLGNTSGAVTKTYDYDAFGNEKNIDANDTNPMRYCGEYFDKETGTIYLRARNYDARIGRFVSEDSYRGKANDPLSLNLYTYCYNDPLKYADSNGHEPTTLTVVAVGGVCLAAMLATTYYYINTSEGKRAINQMNKDLGYAATYVGGKLDDIASTVKTYVDTKLKQNIETRDNTVYLFTNSDGEVTYVGRTNNYERRRKEHSERLEKSNYTMTPIVSGLTKEEAKGMEQIMISTYTLEALENARREIAVNNVYKAGQQGARAAEVFASGAENDYLDLMGR